uniref:PPM-type phosphatase domain-containing protein n=1 Tax=Strigamia maritima TaxID=126957 RepID=T1IYH4_STRMM
MAGKILQTYYRYVIRNISSVKLEPVLIISHNTVFKRWKFGFPKLTPQQVNTILKTYEKTEEIDHLAGAVKSFDTNQLPSNNPIEDRRCEGRCVDTTGLLFGVFDGHAGSACAEIVSQRIFNYLAASFIPRDLLIDYAKVFAEGGNPELIKMYNKRVTLPSELSTLYSKSFNRFVYELMEDDNSNFDMAKTMEKAFLRLDKDISDEALLCENPKLQSDLLSIAASGSVACVAHIDGPHLHIANVGDCRAVLGVLDENNEWMPNCLTTEHNYENTKEVNRILSEHPPNERQSVIKHDRLLGQLEPLRAFGDCRYKWSLSLQKDHFVPLFGHQCLPPNYHTPPYLTARPEVTYHRLMPRDRFLVMATDGLWDQISVHKVIHLVGEYMRGRQTLDLLQLPNKNMKLREVKELLEQRREGLKSKLVDANAATHLIRNALGGTEYGVEHSMLSQMLCYSDDVVRLIRDDITITVVFFDSEYLRHCPV